jgi:excisionase family DNA binding protein
MTKGSETTEPILLSKAAVAGLAGVTLPTIDLEIEEGNLQTTRIRRRVLIHRRDLEDWLDRCRGVSGKGASNAA